MIENRGVYLDEPYSNALIVLGYNERLISSYTDGKSPYEKNFLSKFTNPSFAQVALQNLVLYSKCYMCPRFDNFVLGDLEKKGVLEIAKPDFIALDPEMVCPVKEEEIIREGLLYPTLTHLHNQNINISSNQLLQIVGKLNEYNALLKQRFELNAKLLLVDSVQLPSGSSSKKIQSELRRESEEINGKLGNVVPIFDALGRVYELTKISAKYNVPALWNCQSTPEEKTLTIKSIEQDDMLIVGIYFANLNNIKVNTLSRALDLIHHKGINDFRHEVFSIIQKVKEGKINADKVYKNIHTANKILKDCKLAGKVGILITIAGIPALAYSPLSAILTVAGGSLVIASYAIRRKLKWALVSNI